MKEIIITALIMGVVGAIARIIAPLSQSFVTWVINKLVTKAEYNIMGSKMGTQKKDWVIKKLHTFGIAATESISDAIDIAVDAMNNKQSDLKSTIEEDVSAKITNGITKATSEIKNKLSK